MSTTHTTSITNKDIPAMTSIGENSMNAPTSKASPMKKTTTPMRKRNKFDSLTVEDNDFEANVSSSEECKAVVF